MFLQLLNHSLCSGLVVISGNLTNKWLTDMLLWLFLFLLSITCQTVPCWISPPFTVFLPVSLPFQADLRSHVVYKPSLSCVQCFFTNSGLQRSVKRKTLSRNQSGPSPRSASKWLAFWLLTFVPPKTALCVLYVRSCLHRGIVCVWEFF